MSENQNQDQPEQPEESTDALNEFSDEQAEVEPEFAAGMDESTLADSFLLSDDDEMPEITVNPAAFGQVMPKINGNGTSETTSLDMLLDIGLQVTVELGRAKMTIKDVLALGPGTVVELNRIAGEPVDILINDKPIAKGEVVVIGDMFGVRVTDIIPPAARVQSML